MTAAQSLMTALKNAMRIYPEGQTVANIVPVATPSGQTTRAKIDDASDSVSNHGAVVP